VYLSSDYYVISEDQVPAKKNETLPPYSKSARPTTHAACSESARSTTHAASHESARPTLTPARLSAYTASAQIGLTDSQSAKPISLVTATADASLDDSALVDRSSEIKNHIIQIKDIHFSDMINKVQNTNIFA
jgi:siroheme synthase